MNAKETPTPEYIDYVVEIENAFIKEMEKKYKISCIGTGGSMPFNVEKMGVRFQSFERSSIEEARKMEVWGVQKFLELINSHPKIRPFLEEYPFTPKRVKVSISFRTKKGLQYTDGSPAFVFTANGRIYYRSAAMVTRMSVGGANLTDSNNPKYYPPKEETDLELIDLDEESFEDAVKIIEAQSIKSD